MRFRSSQNDTPGWGQKALAALAYILLGNIVAQTGWEALGGLLSIFMLLGILVWALVLRNHKLPHFVRYHVAQSLLLNMALTMVYWLLFSVLMLFAALPGLSIVTQFVATWILSPLPVAMVFEASVVEMVTLSIAIVLAAYAMRGKYVEIPMITNGTKHWL